MEKLDVRDILSDESEQLKVEPSMDQTDPVKNDLGQLVPTTGDTFYVNEPLIPAGLNTNLQAMLVAIGGGSVTRADAFWYSAHQVAEGSYVSEMDNEKRRYKITGHTDFSRQAGFYVYGLEAVGK